jgi:predicted transcriptional regulator
MTRSRITREDFSRSTVLKAHSHKSKAVARALDHRAAVLPYSRVFTRLEFVDFLTHLTPKRFELLRIASQGRYSIADLALAAQRNPSAVSRDIAKLSDLGLVNVESVSNDGHGRKKVVSSVAREITISAAIAAG